MHRMSTSTKFLRTSMKSFSLESSDPHPSADGTSPPPAPGLGRRVSSAIFGARRDSKNAVVAALSAPNGGATPPDHHSAEAPNPSMSDKNRVSSFKGPPVAKIVEQVSFADDFDDEDQSAKSLSDSSDDCEEDEKLAAEKKAVCAEKVDENQADVPVMTALMDSGTTNSSGDGMGEKTPSNAPGCGCTIS